MYLVDTSVWIDYLRAIDNVPAQQFARMLANGLSYGITQRHLSVSYREAAGLFFRCRREGVTIRNTIDCLIAQIAIEHELLLLHNHRDFDRMANVIPQLRLA